MLSDSHIAHPERIKALLKEADDELQAIQPRLDELERALLELNELKRTRQRLLGLKTSLQNLLDTATQAVVMASPDHHYASAQPLVALGSLDFSVLSTSNTFYPDKALHQVDHYLKHKGSLNYQIFQAVVYNGGKATTEQIRTFLIENDARQPQTGEGFENEPLSQISSRANYLVRKGILHPTDRGSFFTHLGWEVPQD